MYIRMKRMKLSLVTLFIICTAIIFTSCETDIDVTAEWKDITVAYGILNQNDTAHYLKINKAFLGDGNSLVYAQNADSSSYFNNLEVTLTEVALNGSTRVVNFDTVHIANKDEGVFYAPKQVVYKSDFKVPTNLKDQNYRYDLKVLNKITGKEVTSSTYLVKDFDITTPRYGQPTIDFLSDDNLTVKWRTAKDGRRYDVFIRFWFQEVFNTTDTTDRYIDWKLGSAKSKTLNGGEEMVLLYQPTALYDICKSLIPRKDGREDEVTARLTNKVEYTIISSGDALNTYLEVNGPSSGISQDRPEYSNIENGLGLFSCRYNKFISINVGAQTEARFIEMGTLKFVDKLGN